jgi:hypothetical protein
MADMLDFFTLSKRMVNGGPIVPASSSVGGNEVCYYGLGFPRDMWEASNYYVDVSLSSAGHAPILSLSFSTLNPSPSSTTSLGAIVATITASGSNGQPFTGRLGFGPQSSNAGGVFAISGSNLIINSSGPGGGGAGGTVEQVFISATR